LKAVGNIAKSSNFQYYELLLGVFTRKNNWFNLIEKSSKLNATFKVLKMNFGSKFGTWLSFDTAIS